MKLQALIVVEGGQLKGIVLITPRPEGSIHQPFQKILPDDIHVIDRDHLTGELAGKISNINIQTLMEKHNL